ncbi:hypothetical protein ATEIFO6365_0009023500 [Aspergillus terreus]|uniref:Uncharacterized protein n=1 Tax=Aspergillus terreus TaxID=33178 RepID=A0A5M3Z8W2_ASPTE|nr:hypothetical protein ATETN484_0011023500 [Aspergillus terreus]GFF18872.1 hypothetical protein ATEIFO6365_0009023500 [Aspergillus terreus]
MMDEIDLELCLNVEQYNQTLPSTAHETSSTLPIHHSPPSAHTPNPRIRRYDDVRADYGLETEHLHDLPNPQHPPKRARTSSTCAQVCVCEHDTTDPPNSETPASATQSSPGGSNNTAPEVATNNTHTEGIGATQETQIVSSIGRASPRVLPLDIRASMVRSSPIPTPTPTRKAIFTIYEDPEGTDPMDIDIGAPSPDWTSLSPDDDKENEEEEEEQEPLDEERVNPWADGPLGWEEEYRVPDPSHANSRDDTVGDVDEAYRGPGTGYDSIGASSSWTLGVARARGRRRTLPWRAVDR